MRSLLLLLALVLPGAAPPAQIVLLGTTQQRLVAFTFDAGADRGYAASILSTLEKDRVRATFGMTGKWAQSNPDLLRRMARDGDTFIDHTYDHRSFTGYSSGAAPLSEAQRTWEITSTERILRSLVHRSARPYFRPPYGDYDNATLTLAGRLGYRYMIMWTVDSQGWNHLPAQGIYARCLAALRPGDIYLMHVGIQSQDGLALPGLITAIERRGFRLVTIPQLMAAH